MYKNYHIDAWRVGGKLFYRELTDVEVDNVFTGNFMERYWLPGKTAAVLVTVMHGSEPVTRSGAITCALSLVAHTGTALNIDLRF